MTRWFVSSIILLLSFQGGTSYKAAVVDYHPTENGPHANLPQFLQYIAQAGEEKSDIIVFPEIGLNGYGDITDDMLFEIPEPELRVQICGSPNYNSVLEELSCAAKKARVYVVINIVELSKEGYHYNTNIVFDRNGALIARYHKFHLYGEDNINRPPEPELVTFETDFGVTFGTFICFDMLHASPALNLTREKGIKDIVYSTAWFSDLPFASGIQTHAMWAYSEDVNLLSAGYNLPSEGSGGSGIYLGRKGIAAAVLNEVPISCIIFAEVPTISRAKSSVPPDVNEHMEKDSPEKPSATTPLPLSLTSPLPDTDECDSPNQSELPAPARSPLRVTTPRAPGAEEGHYYTRENTNLFNSSLIELKDGDVKQTICYEELCCHMSATITDAPEDPSYTYRLVAFDGVRSYNGYTTAGVSLCAVVLCANSSLSSCGSHQSSTVTFTKLSLSTTLAGADQRMPNTLLSDWMPLSPSKFSWTDSCHKDVCKMSMETTSPVTEIVTFGIYAKLFGRDGQPESKPLN